LSNGGCSLISERLHASPVIAVVVAGLMVGRTARSALDPSRVLALQGFWEVTGFGINVVLFLLVGMQIDARMLVTEAGAIFLAVMALHVGRAVAVYGCFFVLKALRREAIPPKWQHVMVFGNIKGALSMAAVLALPATLPHRERLVTIVFGVTFVTLVTQAPTRYARHWLAG
jgi:CPA1 family monovalent cation:H+ antiporter